MPLFLFLSLLPSLLWLGSGLQLLLQHVSWGARWTGTAQQTNAGQDMEVTVVCTLTKSV